MHKNHIGVAVLRGIDCRARACRGDFPVIARVSLEIGLQVSHESAVVDGSGGGNAHDFGLPAPVGDDARVVVARYHGDGEAAKHSQHQQYCEEFAQVLHSFLLFTMGGGPVSGTTPAERP